MLVLFWSAKGGSGVTVVAAASALVSARHGATVLVDLGGDAHAALGAPDPVGPGVLDWLGAPNGTADGLFRLAAEAADGLRVVGAGSGSDDAIEPDAWQRLASACACTRETVLVDAGRLIPPSAMHEAAARSLLVTRPCFLALRRAARHSALATGAVLLTEPGRALAADDVERALGVPVEAEVAWDPAVARAVDAGLLTSRLPHGLVRQLRNVTPPAAA
jgi:MinD-like ATPase involved in chromosome partitioning or flagellar assembly